MYLKYIKLLFKKLEMSKNKNNLKFLHQFINELDLIIS